LLLPDFAEILMKPHHFWCIGSTNLF
jgi:hypothetical protein